MIDLDLTLFIQLANFLITLLVLNALLIKPVRAIIQKRRDTLARFAGDAAALDGRAKAALDRYQDTLNGARTQGADLRRAAQEDAENTGQTLLAAATGEARDTLRAAREATARDIAQSRAALEQEMPALVKAMVSKLADGVPASGTRKSKTK